MQAPPCGLQPLSWVRSQHAPGLKSKVDLGGNSFHSKRKSNAADFHRWEARWMTPPPWAGFTGMSGAQRQPARAGPPADGLAGRSSNPSVAYIQGGGRAARPGQDGRKNPQGVTCQGDLLAVEKSMGEARHHPGLCVVSSRLARGAMVPDPRGQMAPQAAQAEWPS